MNQDSLRIGSLRLETPVLAAPIAGFTDAIFRDLVRGFGGCGLMFTEMIWAGGWVRGQIEPARLDGIENEPGPLGVQLWDNAPEAITEAARRLAGAGVAVIDLNFGCPKRRIVGRHAAGAALLRDPGTVGRMVAAAVRGAGATPVTAKIRLGPSLAARNAPEVARAAEANGAAAVVVHGRAADQHYGSPCDLEMIAEAVRAVSIPVIANGDVRDAASARRALAVTGAAGVMIGRAALTRPWVFREISAALRGEPPPAPPTVEAQMRMLLGHHAAMVAREGDRRGTVMMRKFAARYLAGTPGSVGFRREIVAARDAVDFRALVERHFPGAAA